MGNFTPLRALRIDGLTEAIGHELLNFGQDLGAQPSLYVDVRMKPGIPASEIQRLLDEAAADKKAHNVSIVQLHFSGPGAKAQEVAVLTGKYTIRYHYVRPERNRWQVEFVPHAKDNPSGK